MSRNYNITLMECNSLISAVPAEWRSYCKNIHTMETGEEYAWIKIKSLDNISSVVYNELINRECRLQTKKDRWSIDIGKTITMEQFLEGITNIKFTTVITKYRSFQYRLLQRGLVTNIHLYKWKLKDTEQCYFCNVHRETYVHLFVMCEGVRQFWIDVEQFMDKYSKDPIHFEINTVLWNRLIYHPKSHIKNFICLLAKQYIYKTRCLSGDLDIYQFKAHVRSIENIVKYYAVKQNRLHKHLKKWHPGHRTNTDRLNYCQDQFITEYINNIANMN